MFKQGQILTLEQGEYSDFQYAGPFRVLRDLDVQSVVDRFQSTVGRNEKVNAFIAWLATEGYIEDVDARRWHLGYYNLNPDGYQNPPEQQAWCEARWAADKARQKEQMEKWESENPHHKAMNSMTTGLYVKAIGG